MYTDSFVDSYETWEKSMSDNLRNQDYSSSDVNVYGCVTHNMCNVINTFVVEIFLYLATICCRENILKEKKKLKSPEIE